MWRTLSSLLCLGILAGAAGGQENALVERFHRLMAEPKELAGELLDYPWRPNLPADLPGLRPARHAENIRIGSVEQPLGRRCELAALGKRGHKGLGRFAHIHSTRRRSGGFAGGEVGAFRLHLGQSASAVQQYG